MTPTVLGVRTERNAPVRFVTSSFLDVAPLTQVIVEDAGRAFLAFVALTADSIVDVPVAALSGRVVAVGDESEAVRQAVASLDRNSLEQATRHAMGTVVVQAAHWSIDLARLDLTVEAPDLAELHLVREALSREVKAEIQFRPPVDEQLRRSE
jgi:hypothetical protein